MARYFTTLGKSVDCPQFEDLSVTLSAKYYFTDNPENAYEVSFAYATCPIVENSRLPIYEQCEDYKYLRCLISDCPHLRDFPQTWDSRKAL